MSVKVYGTASAISRCRGIAHRAAVPGPEMREEFEHLEEAEAALFESYHGKYVKTGRSKRSLTEPVGPDTIRRTYGTELVFGTSVYYDKYQTETRDGMKHTGRNMLIIDASEVRLSGAGHRLLNRIVNGSAL